MRWRRVPPTAPRVESSPPAGRAMTLAPPPVRALKGDGDRATDRSPDLELPHFQTFADVPRFSGILGAGEDSVIKLAPHERDRVVVLALSGRAALIVDADAAPSRIEAIKGKLREHGFSPRRATAEKSVVQALYLEADQAANASTKRGPVNPYMRAAGEWIAYAVANGATDIHLETKGSGGRVRFRIDGDIVEMRAEHRGHYPAEFVAKAMSTLFNNEQQSKSGNDALFDGEKFLYCMVPYTEIPGHALKLRFQSLKGNDGPKTVLRLLHVDENQPTLDFDELGYAPSHVALWREAMNTPSGAVLIGGITGSEKSTTQKTFIELNPNSPTSAIYTIEDPVEYPIRYAHQIPIQRNLVDSSESTKRYSEAITALMRSDPDIMMLGEIRDRFSGNAARQVCETGHMALGTLHAHLLSGMVPRLANPEIGMSRAVLTAPNMLTLLAYQALVPRLCPACALSTEVAEADAPSLRAIARSLQSLHLDVAALRWKREGGCEHCDGRGTVGQTVVAEMLMPDEEWLRPIAEGRDGDALEIYRSRSDGDLMSPEMSGKTVFEHTLYKAPRGDVDARQCARFDTWARFARWHARRASRGEAA